MNFENILQSGFDRALLGVKIIKTDPGRVSARLDVSEAVQNVFGVLHGGAIATLVDDVGTFAIANTDRYKRFGVTTDLNVSYLTAAKNGDGVLIEAEVLMCGLTTAFVDVTLRRERDGKMLASGRMTKFLGDAKSGNKT